MYVITGKDIQAAAQTIKEGRVVAVPTGTSYGLAADALQGNALQRVRNLKNRPTDKTFTVFMSDKLIDDYFDVGADEKTFLDKYKNQPLTLLLRPKDSLTHLAQDGFVGLRVIDHPLMQELADATDVPLTATSANKSGGQPAYTADKVAEIFPGKIDETTYDLSLGYILDGGQLSEGLTSTIIRLNEGQPVTIRSGALKL